MNSVLICIFPLVQLDLSCYSLEKVLTRPYDAAKGCLGMGQQAGIGSLASRAQATGPSAKTQSSSGVRELAHVGLSSTAVL